VSTSRLYKKAPLALVVAEFRHPPSDPLTRGEIAGLKKNLEKLTPLHNPENQVQLQVVMNPAGPQMMPGQNRVANRFSSRDKQSSITFGPESIIVECTRYSGWTRFCELMAAAVTARQDTSPVDGLDRIGLRFIDEIRLGPLGNGSDWSGWVIDDLLPPRFDMLNLGLQPVQQQSAVQYATSSENETITLRYGAVDGPPVVTGGLNLVRAHVPPAGPYFLIDTDAAWTVGAGEPVPEMEAEGILATANRLHDSMEGLFESLITEKLRTEVFEVE
jgi:uncharacterized protein (TIGR04255 family)